MAVAVASVPLNPSPHYRADAFREGLRRCGYEVTDQPKLTPEPQDLLLIWNRSYRWEDFASRYERVGACVLVAENGYIGRDETGHQLFAIALGHHLGAGQWPVGDEDRWTRLNVPVAPWRRTGDEIIVLPQRGIGEPGVAMPRDWTDDVVQRLKAVTQRPIRVRVHPGKARTDPYEDLRNAWAAVTWASGAGIKSIIAGIPVFHELKDWIGGPASKFGIDEIDSPFCGDRSAMFHRLAWAQWTVQEIAGGEPFRWLLG